MIKNMGGADRIIRIIIAIVIGILYWQGIIEGTIGIILLVLSAIFVITSFIGFCPLYRIFGMNTCATK